MNLTFNLKLHFMKKFFTLIILTALAIGANAQLTDPITFEEGYADTAWTIFENGAEGSSLDLTIEENPWASDLNGSDSVLQFVVHDDSRTWVGMYSDYVGTMEFTEEANTMTMMVMKSVISEMRMKLELSINDGEIYTTTVENTLLDEWELIVFSFPDAVGYFYERLTIFPDFPEVRDGGSTVFIDNIANYDPTTYVVNQSSGASIEIFPNPVENRMSVRYPEMTGLTISNVLGQTLKSFAFQTTQSKVIELGDLQTGAYFVTVESGDGIYTVPFVKK